MTFNDTELDLELLAFASIVVFLVEGNAKCELPTGLKSMIYASLKVLKVGISEECINQIISLIPYMNKQEAYNEIAKLSDEKRIRIAGAFVGIFVDDESRFQEVLAASNLPLELVNGEIKKAKRLVYCVTQGTKTYCFASRNEAEEGVKILSENEPHLEDHNQFQISEQLRPIDCNILTPITLKSSLVLAQKKQEIRLVLAQKEQELREWYCQPAFIANDVSAMLDSMVERKRKELGQ